MSIKDYSKFFNEKSSKREPVSTITPVAINLGESPLETSILKEIRVKLKSGETIPINGEALNNAVQYTDSYGINSLVSQVKHLVERLHKPPYLKSSDWDTMVINGGQLGIYEAFNTLCSYGDTVLTEYYSYCGTISCLKTFAISMVGIPMDEFGIIPSEMDAILSDFKSNPSRGKFPRILYTVPTGQNPTSITVPTDRKKAIYELACKYDLLIVEDDPYWHLMYETNEKVQSFLSIDTQHRVLRIDSFSKTLSAGLRLGWITGPTPIIYNMQLYQQCSTIHASGFSQVIVSELLRHWGDSGYDEHVAKIKEFYKKKRDIFFKAAEKHLTGLCEWNKPLAGMFGWFKVCGVSDPKDLDVLFYKCAEALVAIVPGKEFSPSFSSSLYLRISFSISTAEDIDEGLRRLSVVLKEIIEEHKK